MPYRIDIAHPPPDAFDRLVSLGALDVDIAADRLAALLPDTVSLETLAQALDNAAMSVSTAQGRDAESIWILEPRAVQIGSLLVAPAHAQAGSTTLRLHDSAAFGTGLHPTTALCLEAIEVHLQRHTAAAMLDVGTGSGVLALAALLHGVPRAVGLDLDPDAILAADRNAHLNGMRHRLALVQGSTDALCGRWPLVVANVLAAPLMDMAPSLARCLARQGELILSGIPDGLADEVTRVYRDRGVRAIGRSSRAGWCALVLAASW